MKKVLSLLLVCILSLFTLIFFVNADAEEGTEVDANLAATNFFTAFYNDGNYKKDTVINVNENVLDEIENCFHSKVTTLERTTYYQGDKLWMSNSKGYSGYGTEDGVLTQFKVTRQHEEGTSTKTSIEGGMEGYYCTLNDFSVGTHNSDHVESEITLNTGWEYIDGVLASKNADVLEGFRLFTAPLWLNNENTSNYVTFALATIEEEELDNKEGSKNLTRLVMKLWADTIDSNKVNNSQTLKLGDKTYYLFSKAEVYKDFTLAFEGNGTENDPYLIQNDTDWVTFGEHGANKYKFSGEYVKLTANINSTQRVFIDADHGFRGTFDGDNKTITANIVNENTNENRFGVFGVTGRISVVKNLIVEGSITSNGEYTGGIAGLLYGKAYNCHNKASISGTARVGGIAGKAYSTTIDSCTNAGNISGTGQYVGGIAAVITKETSYDSFVISNCENKKDAVITTTYTGSKTNVSGIVAWAENEGLIVNCVNNADITLPKSERISGIVGTAKVSLQIKISNCVNNGNISGLRRIAGIVAASEGNSTSNDLFVIDGCSNYGNVIADSTDGYAGSLIGYSAGGYSTLTNNFVSVNVIISKGTKTGYLCGNIPSMSTISGNKLGDTELTKSNNAIA